MIAIKLCPHSMSYPMLVYLHLIKNKNARNTTIIRANSSSLAFAHWDNPRVSLRFSCSVKVSMCFMWNLYDEYKCFELLWSASTGQPCICWQPFYIPQSFHYVSEMFSNYLESMSRFVIILMPFPRFPHVRELLIVKTIPTVSILYNK